MGSWESLEGGRVQMACERTAVSAFAVWHQPRVEGEAALLGLGRRNVEDLHRLGLVCVGSP